MNIYWKILIGIILLPSCKNERVGTLVIDANTIAEGPIKRDSIFDGIVKYYDIKTRIIEKQLTYSNGTLNGPCIEFYPNGRHYSEYTLSNGELEGNVFQYDSLGTLISRDYYFHGLRVGGCLRFSGDSIESYSFYSLENKRLFRISYDSIKYKKITD